MMATYLDTRLTPQERIAFQAQIGLWPAILRPLLVFAVIGAVWWALNTYYLELEMAPNLVPFVFGVVIALHLVAFALLVLSSWRNEVAVTDRRLLIRCGALRKRVWDVPLADIERFDTIASNVAIRVAGIGPIVVDTLPGRDAVVAAIAAQTGLARPHPRSRRVRLWEWAAAVVSIGSGLGAILVLHDVLDKSQSAAELDRAESIAGGLLDLYGNAIIVGLATMSALIVGMATGFALAIPALRLSLNRSEARVFFQAWTLPKESRRWIKVLFLSVTWVGRRLASMLYGEEV